MAESFDPAAPPPPVLAFLAERHLATLTTTDRGGGLQVTPVGLTYDPATRLARVITWATSQKARNVAARPRQPVALCQFDGGRWLTLHGPARVTDEAGAVNEGVTRYAERYREPKNRSDRVVIEVEVERIIGTV